MGMTQELAAERVAAGVDAMTAHDPDWFKGVDLSTFTIESVYSCVLGQYFGGYNSGLDALGRISGPLHGFDVGPDDYLSEAGPMAAFGMLQAEWVKVLAELKGVTL